MDILALYDWHLGDCFRCPDADTETTLLHKIHTPAGAVYEVRACKRCVEVFEEERQRHAERAGVQYRPGELGVDQRRVVASADDDCRSACRKGDFSGGTQGAGRGEGGSVGPVSTHHQDLIGTHENEKERR